jgi:protoporphyrinogen oxidase
VNKKEHLGYVEGGYAAVFEAARAALAGAGVEVHLSAPVLGMALRGGRIALRTPAGDADFDRALFAVPDPAIPDPDGGPGFPRAAASDHLGVVCALLRLKRGLTPYYVLNLLDTDLPFTGVIESTNVVPPDAFGGARLVYLPKYVTADDPLRRASDADVLAAFLEGLHRIAPDLGDDEILDARVFRDDAVFPRPRRAADRAAAAIRLPWPGAYKANATLLTDDTLNNDAMLKIAAEAVGEIVADYKRKR